MAEGMELGAATIDIRAKLDGLKADMRSSQEIVAKTMSGIKSTIIKALAVVGVGITFKKIMQEAMGAEDAMVDLKASFAAAGITSQKTYNDIKALSTSLSMTTQYSDEAIQGMAGYAAVLGISSDKIEDTVKQAIGLSAAFKKSTDTTIRWIAMAKNGNFELTNRFIPALRSATTDHEKMSIVMDYASKGLGIESERMNTASGSAKQMKKSITELLEAIGTPFLDNIKRSAQGITKWVYANTDAFVGMSKSVDRIFESIGAILNKHSAGITKKMQEWFDALAGWVAGGGLERAVLYVMEWGEKIYAVIAETFQLIKELWQTEELGNAIKYALDVAMSYLEQWGQQAVVLFTDVFNNAVVVAKEAFYKISDLVEDVAGNKVKSFGYKHNRTKREFAQDWAEQKLRENHPDTDKEHYSLGALKLKYGDEYNKTYNQYAESYQADKEKEWNAERAKSRAGRSAGTITPWSTTQERMSVIGRRKVSVPPVVGALMDEYKDRIKTSFGGISGKWGNLRGMAGDSGENTMDMLQRLSGIVREAKGVGGGVSAAFDDQPKFGFSDVKDVWSGFVKSIGQKKDKELSEISQATRNSAKSLKKIETDLGRYME